ncbi:MAG: Eco29kI family restriction endonuclease, partial [Alphaproteobacteria bacterium]
HAEDYLIDLFKPIWNSEIGICYGFGKHGDAPETRANLRSPWDTLHPGRDWAHRDQNIRDAKSPDQITGKIAAHLAANPPVGSIDEILRRFLEEMRGAA